MIAKVAIGKRVLTFGWMPDLPAAASMRRIGGAILLAGLMLCAFEQRAEAQIVALVNGEPITEIDIKQRQRLVLLSTQKPASRQEVLDELINDKLKVNISKRYITEVPKREIDSAFASIARRAGMNSTQFGEVLKKSEISIEAFKARLHADFVWAQILRGKFQATLQVAEKEVEVKLQASNKADTAGFEYRLRPILFLVPKGAAATAFEARKRDAESLRARFQSCDEGVRIAMALPDVAVREMITRQSMDIGQQQRDLLNNTPIGRLTPPDVTPQGVEVFALCNKTAAPGDTPGKREARDQIYAERYQALSKKYLKELRSTALIEMR
jgi:peptidyl-prolyl cis-trans isomerase SurA